DAKRKGKYPNTRFDFLGYCFGPKAVKNKKTKEVFTNFTPRVSASSLKSMRKSIRELDLRRRTHVALADIAQEINPILLGWLNYYGAYTPSALRPIWHYVNATLVVWVMRKYKRYRGAKIQAGRLIEVIAVKRPYIGSSVLPACLPDGSSVKREFQALFCEKPEVQSLRLTLPKRSTSRRASAAGKAS